MPTPTIFWNVDADGDWGTSADWNLGRLPTSADDVAIDTTDLHTVTHSVGTDTVHSLTVGNDDFVVSGGSLTITSTSSFASLLTVSGGTLELDGAATVASFSQGAGTVSGTGNLIVSGPATFTSNVLQTGPGKTLLRGASTVSSSITFGVDGHRTLENQGVFTVADGQIDLGYNTFDPHHSIGGGTLKNDAGSVIDAQNENFVSRHGRASFVNAGTLNAAGFTNISVNFTNTGTIDVTSGNLWFGLHRRATPNITIAGLVSGAGKLDFGAGSYNINSGAIITIAKWQCFGVTTLNENLTYAGAFTGADLTITLGNTLSLTGSAALQDIVGGAGTVEVSSGTIGDFTLGGTAILKDVGTMAQNGLVTLGDVGSAGASLLIGAGATYGVDGGGVVDGSSGASVFSNAGLFIASRNFTVIEVQMTNTGVIEVASGKIAFTEAIAGDGAMTLDGGATLEADSSVAARLGMMFNGKVAILALGSPSQFAATISGFAATDTIDLLATQATRATLKNGDRLVITNASATVATLQLAGDYSAATFNVVSDGHGGTNVTVTLPGGAHEVPAPTHQFIAAMAGLGWRTGGSISLMGAVKSEDRGLGLIAPRMQFA